MLAQRTKEQRTGVENRGPMTVVNMEGERGGEKRGKRSRVGNTEERLLEPNSLKKDPRSGWQPRTIFIFGFCSRLYK